jgi:hypothetical protein
MSANDLLQSIHAKTKSGQKKESEQVQVGICVQDAVFSAAELDGAASGSRNSGNASL